MSHLPEPTIELSDEQIQFFHENGYLSLPSISTPEEIAMMREAYDRIFSSRAGRDEGNQFDLAGADEEGEEAALPQILNVVKYAPELGVTLARANALRVAQQLIGAEAQSAGDHAIFKPARIGAETPWHQDEAYWNPALDYNSLSVWMPLQEATVENGCMEFVPGSQRLEVVSHQPIGNDTRVHGLELAPDAGVDVSQPAICPLPAGGATFHGGRTLHHTGANRSDVPRRAYIMGFATPGTERTEPREFPWQQRRSTAREERARVAGNTEKEPGV